MLDRDGADAPKRLRSAAIGKKRMHLLLLALMQIDDPVAEDIVRSALHDPETDQLDLLLQAVPRAERPLRFAPDLRMYAAMQGHPHCAFAIAALGQIGDEDACLLLMEQLDGSGADMVRMQALRCIGSELARPAFHDAMRHTDQRVRLQGLWGLGKLGSEVAVLTLTSLPHGTRGLTQALADIHGWDMDSTPEDKNRITDKAKQLYSERKNPRCAGGKSRIQSSHSLGMKIGVILLTVLLVIWAAGFVAVTVAHFRLSAAGRVLPQPADAIICLAAGMASPTSTDPGPGSRRRAEACATLYNEGVAPLVIFTGEGHEFGSAAQAMADTAAVAGVPQDAMVVERWRNRPFRMPPFPCPICQQTPRALSWSATGFTCRAHG